MPPPIYFRILGYLVTLTMHGINSVIMLNAVKPDKLENDHENRIMTSMQPYYLTVWNVTCQIAYASLGLLCDVLTLMNKQYLLPNIVGKLRHTLFETLVFPVTMLIFIIFWPVFIYDRDLIFPEFIDRVFSSKSNYVIHLCIVPVVLWELVFQPKSQPKSHKVNILILVTYYVIYNSILIYTYKRSGLWPYPIFALSYGTIYFVLLLSCTLIVGLICYYTQWRITSFIWGHKKLSNKKKK